MILLCICPRSVAPRKSIFPIYKPRVSHIFLADNSFRLFIHIPIVPDMQSPYYSQFSDRKVTSRPGSPSGGDDASMTSKRGRIFFFSLLPSLCGWSPFISYSLFPSLLDLR